MFATTTPVPDGEMQPYRDVDDPEIYNDVAHRVMAEHGIPIDDLYAFALPQLDQIQEPANVHFTKAGSRALADRVIARVRAALARR